MKHAAVQAKSTINTAPNEKTIVVKTAKKERKSEAVLPSVIIQTKASKKIEPTVQKANIEAKAAKIAVVSAAPKSKRQPDKIVASANGDKKTVAEENVSPAEIKSVAAKNIAPKVKKAAPSSVISKPEIENKKAASPVSSGLKKALKAASVSVQIIEPATEKSNENAQRSNFSNGAHKIKSAVNVGKINAALKAIEAAQARAALVEKNEKCGKKSAAKQPKLKIVETEIEAPTPAKTKAKNLKQIGAAVFRGRKNRYDFQVYPLDFEFENVPAIYVISRRKTDEKKRAHHAFVCIGQTDSLLGELARHTRSKCVKKNEANVVSILTEPNEKKRLKIEEDLRAAHAIVCNIVREKTSDSEIALV